MKKFLLYLTLAAFFLPSCKKENSTKPPVSSGKKYAVNFAVSDFTQTISGNSIVKKTTDAVTATGLSASASVLYYLVYNSSGTLIHQINQLSTASNFGNIADSLAAGTYTVIFAAGQTGLILSGEDLPPNGPNANLAAMTYDVNSGTSDNPNFYTRPWQDSFYKKLTLTVSSGKVDQAVSLDRIVGKVEVNVQDAIPAAAKTFQVTFTNEYSLYSLYNNTPDSTRVKNTSPFSYTIPASAIGTTNYTFSTIIANTIHPMTVTIECLDASNSVLAQVTVTNVTCQKNTTTVLSGSLFTLNSAFQIGIDPTWDPTPIIISY